MKKTLALALVLVGCSNVKKNDGQRNPAQALIDSSREAQALVVDDKMFKDSGESKRTPWGGYWWSMARGELVTGWDDGKGRKIWTPGNIKQFDKCLDSYSKDCVDLFKNIAKEGGKHFSPMMKFDYFVRVFNEKRYGKNNGLKGEYSHAALWELNNAYIGDNDAHPLWEVRGFAGKCIGWSLSTIDFDEPTKDKMIEGINFRPADIKGFLASYYNMAKYFVNDELAVGVPITLYPPMKPDEYKKARADVTPKQLISVLQETVKQGKTIVADMDPTEGAWNHPIYKYDLKWKFKSKTKISGSLKVFYPTDEIDLDDVFSTSSPRKDLLDRTLNFEISVPASFEGDFASLETDGEWLGDSKDQHPDALITGIEKGWQEKYYKEKLSNYKDIAADINPPLYKRYKEGNKWKPLLTKILDSYYKK